MATLLWRTAPDWFRVVLYLLMGWLVVVALGPSARRFAASGLPARLSPGGVTYTLGTVVFASTAPTLAGRFGAHDLWHLFVLGGSACYFVLMARLCRPGSLDRRLLTDLCFPRQ